VSARPTVVSSHGLARASARKRAYTADETNERDEHRACRTARWPGTLSERR
jgi:hypothetical protein